MTTTYLPLLALMIAPRTRSQRIRFIRRLPIECRYLITGLRVLCSWTTLGGLWDNLVWITQALFHRGPLMGETHNLNTAHTLWVIPRLRRLIADRRSFPITITIEGITHSEEQADHLWGYILKEILFSYEHILRLKMQRGCGSSREPDYVAWRIKQGKRADKGLTWFTEFYGDLWDY